MRLIIALSALVAISAPAYAATGTSMPAMPKCMTGDKVAWLDSATKTYYMPGASLYGKTKPGKYVCASKAMTLGMHKANSMMPDSNGATVKGSSAAGVSIHKAPALAQASPDASTSPAVASPVASMSPASPGPNPVPSVVRTSSPSP